MPGPSQEYIDSVKDYIRKSRNYDSMSPDDQRKFDMALDSAIQDQLDENGDGDDNPPTADKGSKERSKEGSEPDYYSDYRDDDDVKQREYELMYGDIDEDQDKLDAERNMDGDEAEKSESQEYGGRHR